MNIAILSILCCSLQTVFVQGEDHAKVHRVVISLAKEIHRSTATGDFTRLVELTHPTVVEWMGGKAKMLEKLRADYEKEFVQKGLKLLDAEYLTPSAPVATPMKFYIVVPYIQTLQVPGGKTRGKTFLIGVTEDEGETWRFVSGDVEKDLLHRILTDIPAGFKIPVREKPVFIANP